MSRTFNEKQLRAMMERAAQEAAGGERKRVLWLLDGLIAKIEADLERKILIEQQRHLIETGPGHAFLGGSIQAGLFPTKLKLARAIVGEIRFGVVNGVRPAVSEVGEKET